MKKEQHKSSIYINAEVYKGIIVLFLVCSTIVLSAWTYYKDQIPKGSYPLIYPANFGNHINIPYDNPTTLQGVYLGRRLFYENKLSANNSLSCGSCHQQERAFTDGRPLSIGVDNAKSDRNSMSLANLLWTRKFFWDGRANSLEKQATVPMVNPHEMGQSLNISAAKLKGTKIYPELFDQVYGDPQITGDRIVKAIAQFERTLISANSRYDQYLSSTYQPSEAEMKGMLLFNQAPNPAKGIRGANCVHCHGGVKTYMELFHNNGLDSVSKDAGVAAFTGLITDRGRFKVPTLRNIALTGPYMHDGRFKTLDQVIEHYSEHVIQSPSLSAFLQGESNEPGSKSLKLTQKEKMQLLAFLNMLTDSAFVTDPRFSNPFTLTKNHIVKLKTLK